MGQHFKTIQTNFTSGELSPRLRGRVDINKYYNGASILQNMFPWAHGGATRRTGTQYVNAVKNSANVGRLIPFIFSTVQSYVLEFGANYFRIYRNRAQVVSSSVPVEIVTPYAAADLALLKFTQSADTLYITHPNYPVQKITRTSDTAWTITPVTFLDGPYLNQNSTATTLALSSTSGSVTVTASSTTGINNNAGFASTDVGRMIRWNDGSNWTWLTITAFTDTLHVTAMVSGGTAANTTATAIWMLGAWSATSGYPSVVTIYQERTVWANTTSQPNTLWGSVSGSYENMQPTLPNGTVQDSNAYNFTVADDTVNAILWFSPGIGLIMMGTTGGEYTIYAASTTTATAAITPTNIIIDRQTTHGSATAVRVKRIANSVIFVKPSQRRVLRTTYNWQIAGYQADDVSIFSEHITTSGIVDFDYQEELESSAWMVRGDGQLIGFTYDRTQDVIAWHRHILGGSDPATGNAAVENIAIIKNPTLTGEDIWLLVRRMVNGVTVRYIEFITSPYDPVANGVNSGWFVDAGIAYDGYLNANLTLGATSGTGITFTADQAVFTSSMVGQQIRAGSGRATIASFTDSQHVVCNIISTNPFASTGPFSVNNWYVGAINFTGVTHLEGQVCSVYADGCALPNVTISNTGTFTLDDYYGQVVVGLPYTSIIQTLPDEVQNVGSIQGLIKRLCRIAVSFYQTLGCQFGTVVDLTAVDPTKLEILPFRFTGNNMNQSVPLFTGTKPVQMPGGFGYSVQVYIQQTQPLPLTVLFIEKEFEVNG